MRGGWVYLLANRYRGTICTGVTADLARRVSQHREGHGGSFFAKRYHVARLVHAEEYPTIDEAIAREKAIKKWRRDWKIALIEEANPEWSDLYPDLIGLCTGLKGRWIPAFAGMTTRAGETAPSRHAGT